MPTTLDLPTSIELPAPLQSEAIASAAQVRGPVTSRSVWMRYVVYPLVIGFGLMALQVIGVTLLAGGGTFAEAYQSLCTWDGRLYEEIVAQGYHGNAPAIAAQSAGELERSNVAFFPGYSLAARALSHLTGFSPATALLLTAQLAAWAFWGSLWWFFARWNVPPRIAGLATLAVFVHPAAFYLVVAYSESLFLVSTLAFLFFATADRPRGRWAALPWGILMTATRLAGLPLAACPMIAAGFVNRTQATRVRGLVETATLALVASLGGLGFLAYCQWQFGAWNLYFETQRLGWHVGADVWWLLRPTSYTFWASSMYENALWPDDLSRLWVPLTLLATLGIARWEIRAARARPTHWRERIVFYLAAWVIFGLHAMGVSPIVMKSLIRYSLGADVIALLGVVHAIAVDGMGRSLGRREQIALGLGAVGMLAVQAALAWRFTHQLWVA